MQDEHAIASVAKLRECYPKLPNERARRKALDRLDTHMRNFIARAPFLCLGTSSEQGADVTPRGDRPGFVHVLDDTTILIPDWPGNNRLDSLTNIVSNPRVGLLLFIPGVDETLRINGVAEVTVDPGLIRRWDVNGKHPRSVLKVTVQQAFLHCAKALIRSHLWGSEYRIDRKELPSYGQILKDQTGVSETVQEIQSAIDRSYRENLY
jgi:PPOX class probable FMN-dependent enzyme